VKADSDVGFQEVAGAIGMAQGAVTNLFVVLVTPEAEKLRNVFAFLISLSQPASYGNAFAQQAADDSVFTWNSVAIKTASGHTVRGLLALACTTTRNWIGG